MGTLLFPLAFVILGMLITRRIRIYSVYYLNFSTCELVCLFILIEPLPYI